MERPLPEGVDPTRIEQYLNNDEFTVSCNCAVGHAVTLEIVMAFVTMYLLLQRHDFRSLIFLTLTSLC